MDKVTRAAFTLVELLAVMAIMAIMLAVTVGAFLEYGRGGGMRGSVLNVQTSLNLARQRAITYQTHTFFTYGCSTAENKGYYTVATNNAAGVPVVIGYTNWLADGLVFTNPPSDTIDFTLDGSVEGGAAAGKITIMERDRGSMAVSNVLTLYPLTGRVKVE